jgi:hypothetical protein
MRNATTTTTARISKVCVLILLLPPPVSTNELFSPFDAELLELPETPMFGIDILLAFRGKPDNEEDGNAYRGHDDKGGLVIAPHGDIAPGVLDARGCGCG